MKDTAWREIARKLPKQPCGDLIREIMEDVYDGGGLGENLLLYHREAVTVLEEVKEMMNPEDWQRREETARRRWGARCTCTYCGESFLAGYISKKGRKGIVLAEGEDGQVYDGYVQPGPGAQEYLEGEPVQCPSCWATAEVTHRSQLRRGRTYQVLQAEVENVEGYTVVLYWLVSRYLDGIGGDKLLFFPHSALLIDRGGKLRRFRAKRMGGEVRDVVWVPCGRTKDPMQMPYYSWEAENHRKIGGWTWGIGPELAGCTGEKTALERYIGAEGCWPGAYLHVWQAHPQVENLMRQGFARAVREAIDDQLDRAVYWQDLRDAPPIPWADWREVKPHRMLHLSKETFREAVREAWSAGDLACWDRYRRQLPGGEEKGFAFARRQVGSRAIGQLLDMVAAGWEDLTPVRVTRYLERQGMLKDGVQHLIDYRKILRDAGLEETEETLWPRDLMAAHDRIAAYWAEHRKSTYQAGFTAAFLTYRDLEWTDGELCVVVPRIEEELVEEGRVLRHCVGTYGSVHCSGKPIFFVRHYRRPERSYYTLQIDMTGKTPREVQLHGYGNEHHGAHKEHRHTIPRKVREFCDRWEREVLRQWFARQDREGPAPERERRTA